jgi:flagellar protein FlgJ
MTAPVASPSSYADFQGLEGLKNSARAQDPAALREAARQFESLFTNMMLKSMREASQGESLGDSGDVKFYQDMFDQQLAVQMSKGHGLGLATRLIEQLAREGAAKPAAGSDAPGTAALASPATQGLASGTAQGSGGAVSDADQAAFVQRIRPLAEQVAARLGVSSESVIAQAALETGWGRSLPADASGNSNNYFGIKAGASWQGARVSAVTQEYAGGSATSTEQPFRAYASAAQSADDYASLIDGGSRYAAARNTGTDVRAFATALKQGGYATDPDYVQKVVATADTVRRHLSRTSFKSDAVPPIAAGRIT